MKNDANRWIAAISLLALFAIIAYASRATPRAQSTTNVLVTNSASQPIPIAARPGTGAYIVSVANAPSVKVSSSPSAPVVTKDVNDAGAHASITQGTITLNAGATSGFSSMSTLSASNQTVIDTLNLVSSATAGEAIVYAELSVFDHFGVVQGVFNYLLVPEAGNYSGFDTHTFIPVPANGSILVSMFRNASTSGCDAQYCIAYHAVPNP